MANFIDPRIKGVHLSKLNLLAKTKDDINEKYVPSDDEALEGWNVREVSNVEGLASCAS